MKTLLQVLGFSLALILVFTLVANLLPQIEGESPVEEKVDLSALTMDTFVQMGEKIFKGKGTCTLCHNDLGRAPNLLVINVGEDAKIRLEDSRYQGTAKDIEGYIRESMLDPGIYVVKGFGKKGSNDTESPMPKVTAAPILLTDIEVDAVIAFLQSKDGNDITVALPTDAPPPEPEKPAAPAVAATAEEAINKYTCSACHAVLDSQAPVGPDLHAVGSRLSKAEIRQSIINPAAVIAEGYPPIMPQNIADNMTVKELEMIVEFLSNSKRK